MKHLTRRVQPPRRAWVPRFYPWPVFGAVLAVTGVVGEVRAEEAPSNLSDWTHGCAEKEGRPVAVERCFGDGVVLYLQGSEGALRVEVRRRPGGFVSVGQVSLSPVGEFADWSAEPAPIRSAFDGLVRCVRALGPPPLADCGGAVAPSTRDGGKDGGGGPPPGMGARSPTSRPFWTHGPWFLLLALALAAWSLFIHRELLGAEGERTRTVLTLAGLTMGTGVIRWLWFGPGFFHQNSHGPLWIKMAGCHSHHPYGPGFAEVFGWAASVGRGVSMDHAVFLLQSALAALVPAAFWLGARALGVQGALAWTGAILIAVEPGFARMAGTETYFATISTFLWCATAAIALAARSETVKSLRFLVPVGAAALGIVVAARVHPVAWVPAALVPFIGLAAPVASRLRLRNTALAGALIGLIVAIGTGASLFEVLEAQARWTERASGADVLRRGLATGTYSLPFILVAVGLRRLKAARQLTPVALDAAALVIPLALGQGLNPLYPSMVIGPIYDGSWHLFTGPCILAGLAMLDRTIRSPRFLRSAAIGKLTLAAVGLLVIVGGLIGLPRVPMLATPPTDLLEQSLWLAWRDEVPKGALVVALTGVNKQMFELPLYGDCTPAGRRTYQVATKGTIPRVDGLPREGLYYRSSLCSTPDGKPVCDELESRWNLTPIREAELPARTSIIHASFIAEKVDVGLYRYAAKEHSAQPDPSPSDTNR